MAASWIQDPAKRASEQRRARARALRRSLTEPERKLWWHLRHRLAIHHSHFRRQVPIGRNVADFCCLSAKLVIEVDGNQHGFDRIAARDQERTRFLEGHGFRVIRFSNTDVMTSIDVVLDTIWAALEPATPTPSPSPQGGGEGVGSVAGPASRSRVDPPSPLRGGAGVGVVGSECRDRRVSVEADTKRRIATRSPSGATPTPGPSPQGEGEGIA